MTRANAKPLPISRRKGPLAKNRVPAIVCPRCECVAATKSAYPPDDGLALNQDDPGTCECNCHDIYRFVHKFKA